METASFRAIHQFLKDYAPLQLVHGLKSIRLSKKMLSAAKYVYVANKLVKNATSSVGHDFVAEKLSSILDLGTTLSLPKGSWSAHHDAKLVMAIAKHGWIEQDSSVKSILRDSSLKWGPPFDSMQQVKTSPKARQNLVFAARRVVDFLNGQEGPTALGLKTFNHDNLLQTFELVPPTPSAPWSCDESKLMAKDASAPIELPPKRDLIRRATQLLSGKKFVRTKSDFDEIDLGNQSFLFLCEILRAVIREKSGSQNAKILSKVATREALSLVDSMKTNGNHEDIRNAENILIQVETIEHAIAGPALQYKNLARVMVGEDVKHPKKAKEALFPTLLRQPSGIQELLDFKPTGEEAIEQAQQRRADETTRASSSAPLHLTEIETLILESAISHGIPIWEENWDMHLKVDEDLNLLSWTRFGSIVVDAGKRAFKSCRNQLMKVRKRYSELNQSPVDAASAEELLSCQASWEGIQQKYVSKENLLVQARDYSKEPETLAKKTIMLLAKVNQILSPVQPFAKDGHGLGSDVILWMGVVIQKWAGALDLLDEANQPLAFTAIEFLDELPEDERTSIEIASVFDKKGCRFVLSQITLLTRLRSFVVEYERATFVDAIKRIYPQAPELSDESHRMPKVWDKEYDAVLLYRLVELGLSTKILSEKKIFPSLVRMPISPFRIF